MSKPLLSRNNLTPPAIPATPADSQPSSVRHTGASEETRAGFDHLTQRQDSLKDQMDTVLNLALNVGCFDAHDWIMQRFYRGASR